MSFEIFTQPWADSFRDQVNRNADHRHAASTWQHPVALAVEPSPAVPGGRRLLLDLWRGDCRTAEVVDEAGSERATFILSAPLEQWKQIFRGRSDPILALMQGRVKLLKGGMFALARNATAAKQLVLSATRVPTFFPDELESTSASADHESAPPPAVSTERAARDSLQSLGPQGLRHDSLPMKLYHQAKRVGVWNPQDIDFTADRADWARLNDRERDVILRLTALFQGGEESVTQDILPLMLTVAREGRLEEEMFLTTFLFEEAKHLEFFRRFVDEVIGGPQAGDLARFQTAPYREIFFEELPGAMGALLTDPSPAAQLRASATYNMVVEGTLAETGYHGYYAMLERQNLLPGLRHGIGLLKRDESRHIAYGVFLLTRLVAADPSLWPVLESRMGDLLEPALGIIRGLFEPYGDDVPFGLVQDDFMEFAMSQFKSRMHHIERARNLSTEEVETEAAGAV